jgi:UDP-N-acetylglucosamine transferase subunit ALG13
MKLLIVSSCGGHLTEVRALAGAFDGQEVAYVLNDVVPLREGMEGRTRFIAHSERDWRLLRNVREAWKILRAESPDVILSTGAGPVVPFAWIGRLLGIPTVFVETFTRVNRPSLSARLVYPVAARFLFQWPALAKFFPGGTCCGPVGVVPVEEVRGCTNGEVFVALGNARQPFPRMLSALEKACAIAGIDDCRVVVQHGATDPRPLRGWRQVRTFPESEFRQHLLDAQVVICHAGAGVILESLGFGRRCIVFPRRRADGEHVDDHQVELARALAEEGLVHVAEDDESLADLLRASHFDPPAGASESRVPGGKPGRAVEAVREAIAEAVRN